MAHDRSDVQFIVCIFSQIITKEIEMSFKVYFYFLAYAYKNTYDNWDLSSLSLSSWLGFWYKATVDKELNAAIVNWKLKVSELNVA